MNKESLPMMAVDVSNVKDNALSIKALVKKNGRVTGYQLSNGKIVTKEEGVDMAREGGIKGVGISSRKGNFYLKSLPDGTDNNNLGNLPTVK